MEAHETLPSQPAAEPTPAPAAPGLAAKNPSIAGVLSLFPGIGNVYNGLYLRAVSFFVLIASAIYLASEVEEIFGFAVAFLWIFNVIDAWRQANLINSGYAQDLGVDSAARRRAAGREKLLAGAAFLAFGILGALDLYFQVDVGRLLEHWPLILVAVGVWLVWGAVRSTREGAAAGSITDDLV